LLIKFASVMKLILVYVYVLYIFLLFSLFGWASRINPSEGPYRNGISFEKEKSHSETKKKLFIILKKYLVRMSEGPYRCLVWFGNMETPSWVLHKFCQFMFHQRKAKR
jgi:hypothetical protein